MIQDDKNHEINCQKLIYRGKHLEPSTKLIKEFEIKDKDTLILMVTKNAKPVEQPKKEEVKAPEPVQSQNTDTGKKEENQESQPNPPINNTANVQNQQIPQQTEQKVSEEDENKIKMLESMGLGVGRDDM